VLAVGSESASAQEHAGSELVQSGAGAADE